MDYIINEDAVNFLSKVKDETVDLVLTDPPYLISRESGFSSLGSKSVERFAIDIDFGEWDNVDINQHNKLLVDVFTESYRILKPSSSIIIWYDCWKLESILNILDKIGFRMFRFIEWLKTNPVPINSKNFYLTNSRECAIVAVKGNKPIFKREYHNGVFEYPIYRGKRIHPTQKPLELMKELIDIHTNKGDLVVDPFSGSGTTVLAAYLMDRIGKGCEIDVDYCKQANYRLTEVLGDISAKPIWTY